MKLANEIAKALEEGLEDECFVFYDGQHFSDTGLGVLNKIIAAKLKPVRDLLAKIELCEAPFKRDKFEFANSVIDAHIGLAGEALAMLSKEEDKPEQAFHTEYLQRPYKEE